MENNVRLIFPHVLRQMGPLIFVTGEGYELKFLGKNYARLLASIDTTTFVMADEEHNSKPENMNSENIYISGDNCFQSR
jgi:hypothetical protein